MSEYVCGFVTDGLSNVLLLRKSLTCKFVFMRDKLNGVGGAVEIDETPLVAMQREWREETALQSVYAPPWRHFCTLNTRGGVVYFYHACALSISYLVTHERVRTRPDEPIVCMPIADIAPTNAVGNVRWLIAMARATPEYNGAQRMEIFERYE